MAGEVDGAREQYWTAVSDRIRELVKSLRRIHMPHVTEVLLSGPYAANKRFHNAIRAAFQYLGVDESVLADLGHRDHSLEDQEEEQSFSNFAVAKGAAEIAKRRQEGPVQCVQNDKCRRRRERVRGAQDSLLVAQPPESGPSQGFLSGGFQ